MKRGKKNEKKKCQQGRREGGKRRPGSCAGGAQAREMHWSVRTSLEHARGGKVRKEDKKKRLLKLKR